jgi:hypothetical protein
MDEVEKIGITRAWGEIDSADAVLFLHDLTRQHTPEDPALAAAYIAGDADIQATLATRLPAATPVIHVWNKTDSAPEVVLQEQKNAASGSVQISAKTGAGLQALREQLLKVVGWQSAPEGVFMAREGNWHGPVRNWPPDSLHWTCSPKTCVRPSAHSARSPASSRPTNCWAKYSRNSASENKPYAAWGGPATASLNDR